jgi:hypothetical protein
MSPFISHSPSTFFPFFSIRATRRKFSSVTHKKNIFLCPLSHLSPVYVCEKNPNDFSRPNCLDTREQLKKASLDVLFGYSMLRKSLFQLSVNALCCVLKIVQLESARELSCSWEQREEHREHDNVLNEYFCIEKQLEILRETFHVDSREYSRLKRISSAWETLTENKTWKRL